MSSQSSRANLLNNGSLLVAREWTNYWCQEMQRDGRAVEGGWPGTVPEARARVRVHFDAEFSRRGMLTLSPTELVEATRATYDKAKREWLERQLPTHRRNRRTEAAQSSPKVSSTERPV